MRLRFIPSMSPDFSWRRLFLLAATLAYAPFLNLRLLPTAGDEKVYVTQALEMIEAGRLFVQSLFGEPNYFKGPLHYLLIQLGYALFGLKLIALRYMNLPLILISGLAVGSLVETHLAGDRRARGLALWSALGTALCAGAIGHVLASQMEIELLCAYSVAMLLLDRAARNSRAELAFWIVAGLAGWIKSPLHSGLLGVSFWLYFAFSELALRDGSFRRRISSARSLGYCALGVVICIAGYLPAAFQDWNSFQENYIQRENLSKSGGNGGPGWQAWFPLFFYYLFPWNWMALAIYLSSVPSLFRGGQALRRLRTPKAVPYFLVAAMLIPIVAFFWWHPYRGENYTYPAQGAVFLLLALLWSLTGARSENCWTSRLVAALTALQLLVPAAFLLWIALPFCPEWLPTSAFWLVPGLALISAAAVLAPAFAKTERGVSIAAMAALPFAISIHLILYWAGDREMTGIREYLQSRRQASPLCYLNLDRNIWNELGYLSFTLGTRVRSCHTTALAAEHVRSGGTLIVPRAEQLEQLVREPGLLEGIPLESKLWKRWGRHAHIPAGGRSPLMEVRTNGNWSALERDFLLVSRRDSP